MHVKMIMGIESFNALAGQTFFTAYKQIGLWPINFVFLGVFIEKKELEEIL